MGGGGRVRGGNERGVGGGEKNDIRVGRGDR